MKTILVIDDNEEIRENVMEILAIKGYAVLGAKNGKIGLSKILEQKPDLVISDIMMPEMDGLQTLNILRNPPYQNNTPFIFLTAYAEKSNIAVGSDFRAHACLTKPFGIDDLLKTIEDTLKSEALKAA